MATTRKPATAKSAESKPAAKKRPAAPSKAKLAEIAETAEHEVQTVIEAAGVSGWEPSHVEQAAAAAKVAADARAKLGEQPADHCLRFLETA